MADRRRSGQRGGVPITMSLGIGAGKACDQQVLVINDAIGMGDKWPPFSHRYAHVNKTITEAAKAFGSPVKVGTY